MGNAQKSSQLHKELGERFPVGEKYIGFTNV